MGLKMTIKLFKKSLMSDVFSKNMGEDLYKKGSGAFCLECGKEMQKYKGEDSRFYCKHCNKSYFGEDVF